MADNKFVFLGAGEVCLINTKYAKYVLSWDHNVLLNSTRLQAAIGIADLCVKAMEADGCTKQQARDNIWMMDIDGLLVKNRSEGSLEGHKIWYAKDHKVMKTLIEVVTELKPTVLIGKQISSKRNDLSTEI